MIKDMIKEIITSVLLSLAIGLIVIGIHINNSLFILLGGFTCAVYNDFIMKKNEL